MNSIEVINLTKKFGAFTAVNSINFKVAPGEIFGFLGANGAGKSTTIRMLCGILAPTSGDAFIGGINVIKNPNAVKKNIGYMSQKFSLYNDLTVEENIFFFGGIYGLNGPELKERMRWILKIANLNGKENLLTGSLPGGIKQRLALGTAVIHNPGIVFLDEPTSGVDPISRRNFWELISDLSGKGTTVLVTTHYLEEAEYCNNIIMIDGGSIIAEGSPKFLKEKYIRNTILEIESEKPVDAIEILEREPFVEEASVFGNNIHLSVNEKYDSPQTIRNLLENNYSINIKKINVISPSLEDVFLTLLEKNKSGVIANQGNN